MGRKNDNARPKRRYSIPVRKHFMYSTEEFGSNPTIVRYMGEQDGDYLKVWHPEGFEMWAHVHHLSNPSKVRQPELVGA